MTDAIRGEGGAYSPCREAAAPLPEVPPGAIVGTGVGFVPRGQATAALPADPHGAITGSQVGFVAGPCCAFDDFAREVTEPIEQTHSVSLAGGSRSAWLARRDRSTTTVLTYPPPAPELLGYWSTNGLITDPVTGNPMSGPGMSALNGPPFDDMHYDVEERIFTAPDASGGWPANCTLARFWKSGSLPRWSHHPTWIGLHVIHDTTMEVWSGFWQGASTGWDDGELVAQVVIPAGVDYVDTEIEWEPAEGMPDYVLRVASAVEVSPFATGTKYVNDDDTINFDNLASLQARYPDDKNGQYPFPPGGGDVWAQNDASDVAFHDPGLPQLEVTFFGPPGWGTGPEVEWDQWTAGGDDWSDSVMVTGGFGLLRTHLSTKAATSSYAEVYHSEELHRDFDDIFRVRFDNVTAPVTPYDDGVSGRIGPARANLVIYPDNDRIDFGPTHDIDGGGIDWTDWVLVHIQEDAAGSRASWWQETGGSEPGAWMAENIGGSSGLEDGTWDFYYFLLDAPDPYSRDLTLYISCPL